MSRPACHDRANPPACSRLCTSYTLCRHSVPAVTRYFAACLDLVIVASNATESNAPESAPAATAALLTAQHCPQVTQIIDESSGFSSGPANPNLYYANAVHHSVHSTTGVFERNTDGDISGAILQDFEFTPGGVNIAAGITDLRGRFSTGGASTATGARFAFIITDGFDDPARVAAAAQELRDAGVTIIAVAPSGLASTQNLQAIASTPDLAVQVTSIADIAETLLATIATIGVLRAGCGC